jgi:LAO/AO transport system kinase
MATRGSLGGLAAATREVTDVLDAFGLDRILIETVGVGQSELDIARTADSSLVVLVPESGDSIQTLKAGLMEIADVFAVNKADRPGADRLRNELELMLGLRDGRTLKDVPAHHGVDLGAAMRRPERREGTKAEQLAMNVERKRKEGEAAAEGRRFANPGRAARQAAKDDNRDQWTPPVLRTVGVKREGIDDVVAALDRHFSYLEKSGTLVARRRARLRERVVDVVQQRVRDRFWRDDGTNQWLDDQLHALETGSTNPFDVADALLARSGNLLTQDSR